ncbi:MAG TPA: protein-tyrosine-phosphatase [Chryseolinea sp.]|nr:protein-tyrosine-phosphatase [Chryseolinea sp.]
MQFSSEKLKLYTTLVSNIERCVSAFSQVPDERKKILNNLSQFVGERIKAGKEAKLIFICTHNSRRSHMAQSWAQAAAAYYGTPKVVAYSGGTEITAFNSRAVKTMEELGFRIRPTTKNDNPIYEIRISDDLPPIKGFSKKYDDPENPRSEFAAIMTCSHADENCPFVAGAEMRMTLPFDDPKNFDDTSKEVEMYKERAYEIGREILYSFSQLRVQRQKRDL